MNEDKSSRYRRRQRQASILAAVTAALFLILLVVSGGSVALRDTLGGGRPWLSMLAYSVMLVLALEVIQLPLAYYQGVTL